MRIRDRLIALAPASLSQHRMGARAPSPSLDSEGVPSTSVNDPVEPPVSELPREVSEQMLYSFHISRNRLIQTSEALGVIAASLEHAEATLLSAPLEHPRLHSPNPRYNAVIDALDLSLRAANARDDNGGRLFAGAPSSDAPFASDGSFRGVHHCSAIVAVAGPPPALAVAASALTRHAATGDPVDILGLLSHAITICNHSEEAARTACRVGLRRASAQIVVLQDKLALAISLLADASSVVENTTPVGRTALVDGEMERTSAQLSHTFGAIEAARSLAERTLAIFPSLS
jgi:hypothetical protein